MGKFHPRRTRILSNLLQRGLLKHIGGPTETLGAELQKAAASVNVTLNSDLNSRVFEIAQTGCLQIIDRLAAQNGYGSVLIPQHNCLTFTSASDLEDLLSDTAYLRAVGPILGKNLRDEYDSHWGSTMIRNRFTQSIQTDQVGFLEAPNRQTQPSTQNLALSYQLQVYESMLELHRTHEEIELIISGKNRELHRENLADLPRLKTIENIASGNPSSDLRVYITEKETGEPELFRVI
jgi:hypothetical protein